MASFTTLFLHLPASARAIDGRNLCLDSPILYHLTPGFFNTVQKLPHLQN